MDRNLQRRLQGGKEKNLVPGTIYPALKSLRWDLSEAMKKKARQ